MELRHLRCLVAVAHHRSFTKAGEELHLAQSAISQHVRRLEQELGVDVFRRNSRSVDLTPEGRLVLAYAQRVLDEVEGMHTELEEMTGLLRGEVRIGGMYPTGVYDLPTVLADFRAQHGEVSCTCSRAHRTSCSTCCAPTISTACSPRSTRTGSATSSRPPSCGRTSTWWRCRSTTRCPAAST